MFDNAPQFLPNNNTNNDAAYYSFSPRTSVDPEVANAIVKKMRLEYERTQSSISEESFMTVQTRPLALGDAA